MLLAATAYKVAQVSGSLHLFTVCYLPFAELSSLQAVSSAFFSIRSRCNVDLYFQYCERFKNLQLAALTFSARCLAFVISSERSENKCKYVKLVYLSAWM